MNLQADRSLLMLLGTLFVLLVVASIAGWALGRAVADWLDRNHLELRAGSRQ